MKVSGRLIKLSTKINLTLYNLNYQTNSHSALICAHHHELIYYGITYIIYQSEQPHLDFHIMNYT